MQMRWVFTLSFIIVVLLLFCGFAQARARQPSVQADYNGLLYLDSICDPGPAQATLELTRANTLAVIRCSSVPWLLVATAPRQPVYVYDAPEANTKPEPLKFTAPCARSGGTQPHGCQKPCANKFSVAFVSPRAKTKTQACLEVRTKGDR